MPREVSLTAFPTQHCHYRLEVGRGINFANYGLAGYGVDELKLPGVKHLAVNHSQQLARKRTFGGKHPTPPGLPTTVFRVAEHRVSEVREVDANLVRAAGLKRDFEQVVRAVTIYQEV